MYELAFYRESDGKLVHVGYKRRREEVDFALMDAARLCPQGLTVSVYYRGKVLKNWHQRQLRAHVTA